jgi:hypothetical protein
VTSVSGLIVWLICLITSKLKEKVCLVSLSGTHKGEDGYSGYLPWILYIVLGDGKSSHSDGTAKRAPTGFEMVPDPPLIGNQCLFSGIKNIISFPNEKIHLSNQCRKYQIAYGWLAEYRQVPGWLIGLQFK